MSEEQITTAGAAVDSVPEIATDPEILVRSSELDILRAKSTCYDSICEIGRVQAYGQQLAIDLQGKEKKLAETLQKRS